MKAIKLFPDILNRNPFLFQEHPVYHPIEQEYEYEVYWLEQEKRCIEGMFVEETKGRWRFMPPQLYFYVNICKIIDEDKETNSTIETSPILRDLDWVMGTDYFICRGFSGYIDSEFTCNELILKLEQGKKLNVKEQKRLAEFKHVTLPNGEYKKYRDPQEVLRDTFKRPYGRPVYENNAKNYILFGSRGGGKSFFVASCLNHEWYFNGVKSHESLLEKKPSPIELLLTAGSQDKSNDLMTKIKLTQDYIHTSVGAYTDKSGLEPIFYPGFFHKESTGSTTAGASVPLTQKFKQKRGNSWLISGIGTTLTHKTITTENPNVASGKRNNLQVVEEGGLVANILDFYGTAKNAMIRSNKFGTLFIIGTSGNMDKLAGIKRMFENPEEYDFLAFVDEYEGRSKKIGRFLPAYYADEDFRDEQGNTNVDLAYEHIMNIRAALALSETSSLLDDEMMNRPIVPSEMFMNKAGLKFPVVKIRARKTNLDIYKLHEKIWSIGSLEYTDKEKNQVKWIPDLENKKRPILTYNLDQYNHDYTSAIVVYEHPPEIIPDPTYKRSLYKITYDPVKDDKGGTSLASIIVYKGFANNLWEGGMSDTIVAEWIGRLDSVNAMHEIALKLGHYYNAKILPETNISDIVRYAEMQNKYSMLQPALTVAIGKVLKNPTFKYEVGIDMTSKTLQEHAIQLLRQWLLNPRKVLENGIITETNIDYIYSLRLLNELEIYNGEGNYDHLRSAMILALWMSQETEEPIEEANNNRKYEEIDEYFLQKNRQLEYDFYHKF